MSIKLKCYICEKEFMSRGFSEHLKKHNIRPQEYYDTYLKQEDEGKCVQCGNETDFISFSFGYKEHCCKECAAKTVSQRAQETCLRKYGVNTPLKSQEVKDKIKKTSLERYGVENVLSSKIVQEKIRKTNLERYGVENVSLSKEIRDKANKTNLERYGAENVYASEYGKQKIKETNLERYGVENASSSKEVQEKVNETCKERYGGRWCASEEILEKTFLTQKKNKTINTSKTEKELEIELRKIFPDLKTQYKSEVYPFACDYYIPSLDLYIEYNGFFTHNRRFFDKNNKEDIEELNRCILRSKELKKKNGNKATRYDSLINVWTYKDLLKLETAVQNNLNYIAWFNEEQAYDWIEKYKENNL